MITDITRQLAYEYIQDKIPSRQALILEMLNIKPMTAQEIADELYKLKLIPDNNRGKTAPRLTEMEKLGLVKQVGAKKDYLSKKMVTIYAKM